MIHSQVTQVLLLVPLSRTQHFSPRSQNGADPSVDSKWQVSKPCSLPTQATFSYSLCTLFGASFLCLRRWDVPSGPSERELLAIRMFGDERGLALPLARESKSSLRWPNPSMQRRMHECPWIPLLDACSTVRGERVILECVPASRCM
jgi:hypothetical protein